MPAGKLASVFPAQEFVPRLEYNAPAVTADTRHDRLTTGVATLVSELPARDDTTPPAAQNLVLGKPFLVAEVFPSLTFQPDQRLTVTIRLGHQGVSLRLCPWVESGEQPAS